MLPKPACERQPPRQRRNESGIATLLALIALSVFSLLSLFLSLDAATEACLSDNAEAHLQAIFAAKSGLEHAGELLNGLEFDDLLRGPDGAYDGSATYLSQAGTHGYRNPLTWVAARALDVDDPAPFVLGLTDDGLLNTGRYGISPGTVLIPLTGVAFRAPRHNGSGLLTTARYFVKVSDNNGEATERALDPEDNPFLDGDGIIVVRSMGVSRTIRETLGVGVHSNAISAFEARFKRTRVFNLDAPMVILANEIAPSGEEVFSGASFRIDGRGRVGLATVDTAVFDGTSPAQALSSALSPEQSDAIQGAGLRPSIQDITASISGDPDRALLLNPDFLWNLVSGPLTRGADRVFVGNQSWVGGDSPDLGSYDPAKEANDPGQKPRLTVVDGDLAINGSYSGAGLLVVREIGRAHV